MNYSSSTETQTMCMHVNHLWQQLNTLKSQSFHNVPKKKTDLVETFNKIIHHRSHQLNQYNQACKNNNAQSLLPIWKTKQIEAEHSLELAETIKNSLLEKTN